MEITEAQYRQIEHCLAWQRGSVARSAYRISKLEPVR
jgi:hypothetical protein